MKKNKILLIFIGLLSFIFCLKEFEDFSYDTKIEFQEDNIMISGEGVILNGTNANIYSPGVYLITGMCKEGSINVNSSSVQLYLEDLDLSSSVSSPILIEEKLTNIKIHAINNVKITDNEERNLRRECASITIRDNNEVNFYSQNKFYINGRCKDGIKSTEKTYLRFYEGEFIINAYRHGIYSNYFSIFYGGKYNIKTENGIGIYSSSDENLKLGKGENGRISVDGGDFIINSFSDAFRAEYYIYIENGNFSIKTEQGYNSLSFNKETGSAKGFFANYRVGISKGNFIINTPDTSFHSENLIDIYDGKFTIYSGYNGFYSARKIYLGFQYTSLCPIIDVKSSYNAIVARSIDFGNGLIKAIALKDGVNTFIPNSEEKSEIYLYDGEYNITYNENGIRSNGNIYFLGGDINLFQDKKGNNIIEYSGDFYLNNSVLFSVAKQSKKKLEKIIKSNQTYAIYRENIQKNKLLFIENGNKTIVKQIDIKENFNYFFYSSYDLNENYSFYISESNDINYVKVAFTFGELNETIENDDEEEEEKKEEEKNYTVLILIISFSVLIGGSLIFYIYRSIKRCYA